MSSPPSTVQDRYLTCHNRDRTYPYSPYPDLSTPIPSHQNHSQAPNAKPEPSGSIPSQLISNASPNPLTFSRLSNALPNTPTPLCLVDAFPTRRSFDLSSSLRQVDSQHPHSFPTRCHSTFTLLRQVYPNVSSVSRLCLGEARLRTSLDQCILVRLSLLSIYMFSSVCCTFLCHITRYPPLIFYFSSSVPCLHLPLFHLSLFFTSITPTLVISYIHYEPFPIVQIIPIITTPHTCINTLSTSCCSSV